MPTSQPDTLKIQRVFIASPNDIQRERENFRRVLEDVNTIKASALGLRLEPLGWEDVLPAKSRPQALIHQDIRSCDLFILLLWERWGVPSGEHVSAAEEAFDVARRLNEAHGGRPALWLYFKRVPGDMLADPGTQLRRVLDFRRRIEAERSLFYHPYDSADAWKSLLHAHLCRWLEGLPPFDLPSTHVELPPDIQALQVRLAALEAEAQIRAQAAAPARTKQAQAAASLTRQAVDAARLGRRTQAAECFAAALALAELPATLLAYSWFLSLSQQWDQQIAACSRALEIQPAYARAYSQRALAYCAKGLLARALADCYAAIRLQPDLATPYTTRALIYRARGALSCALADFGRAIELQPNDPRAYRERALIHRDRGDRPRALADLRQALALAADPEFRAGLQQELAALRQGPP